MFSLYWKILEFSLIIIFSNVFLPKQIQILSTDVQKWPWGLVGNFLNDPNKFFYSYVSKSFQTTILPTLLLHISWEFLALFLMLNTAFFIVFFSWTAFKYFRLKMIYLCIFTGLCFVPIFKLPCISYPAFPSHHLPDSRKCQDKVKTGMYLDFASSNV